MSAAAELGFARWQPEYARCGIATFPVRIVDGAKIPAVRNYTKIRLPGSAQLALKFGDVPSLGFMCGPRNRLTVIDLDSTDESIVAEGERIFGPSPVVWRTGGGRFAMAYRYNGEPRRIKVFGKDGPQIDILGRNGFAVAPPSAGVKRPYEFCRGTIADLDRLPMIRGDIISKLSGMPANDDAAGRIPQGRRHAALFQHCSRIVAYCDTLEQLIDNAQTWADDRLEIVPGDRVTPAEIQRTCHSVWNYRGGRKRMMVYGPFVEAEQWSALARDINALALLVISL